MELVHRGMTASRSRAQQLIAAGAIAVDGVIATRPAMKCEGETRIDQIADPLPWVSRAALKLVAALDAFDVPVADRTALDIGASTGGFTEVLLSHGIGHVWAVDVGHGQMNPAIAAHPRVTPLAGVNARDLGQHELGHIDLIVSDVSFISLTKALPPALGMAGNGADLVALVKPQFEVGPSAVGKGGIVTDNSHRQSACTTVTSFLEQNSWSVLGLIESPITGSDGNIEYLLHARAS